MASAITIDVSAIKAYAETLKARGQIFAEQIDSVLTAGAIEIATAAKQNAPVDRGILNNAISPNISQFLHKEVNVNVFYAAFVEFGTGAKAATYVSSLPADWQQFAAQFKGQKGGGTFADMVKELAGWVKRLGLSGTYSVKTKRRKGNKETRENEDMQVAYQIARAILIKGVTPHPFLYPAFEQERNNILSQIETVIKNFA